MLTGLAIRILSTDHRMLARSQHRPMEWFLANKEQRNVFDLDGFG